MIISPTEDVKAVRLGEIPEATSVDREEKHSNVSMSENAEEPAKTLQDQWMGRGRVGELGDCCPRIQTKKDFLQWEAMVNYIKCCRVAE